MKLWLKQTLVTLAVILLSVSMCLYHFVAQETDQLIQQAIQSGARDTAVFCDHLSTLERTSTAYDMDIITRQALIQYKFSTYAHLLQTGDCTWSLVMDGQYYYNTASCQPMETLPMAEDAVAASRIVERGGTHLLISAQSMSVLQTPLTVYRAANIESTYQHINDLTRAAQLSLLGCLLLCGVLLPLLLRKTLAPLRKLAQISDKIACGAYDLRANISADDEVGELARAFDHMADTVEQKNCRFGGYRPAALAAAGGADARDENAHDGNYWLFWKLAVHAADGGGAHGGRLRDSRGGEANRALEPEDDAADFTTRRKCSGAAKAGGCAGTAGEGLRRNAERCCF